MGPTVVAFLVFVGLLFFDQFIEKGRSSLAMICENNVIFVIGERVVLCLHHKGNFAEQNSFLFFNRLGRY